LLSTVSQLFNSLSSLPQLASEHDHTAEQTYTPLERPMQRGAIPLSLRGMISRNTSSRKRKENASRLSVVIAEHVLLLRKLALLVLVGGCPRPGLPHLLLPERAYHFHGFRFLIGVLM
jgi:hypothetical protein